MNKSYTLTVLILFQLPILFAQNLVANGDFETYSAPPISSNYGVALASGWQNMSSHGGSCDYFTNVAGTAANHDWTNFAGNANAHGGNGYIGMGSSDPSFNGVEISTRALSSTLVAGSTYTVSAWVFQAYKDWASTAWCKNFGIKFNVGNPVANGGNASPCPMSCNGPYTGGMVAVKASANTVGRNTWQLITTSYVATGTETHIILGTFNLAASSSVVANGASVMGNASGYVYFDDVSVVLEVVAPITLTSFDVSCEKQSTNISWTTSSEINNDYFVVERSVNCDNWEPVSEVKGMGSSSKNMRYSAVDANPLSGISYYRLKQIDFDGSSTYSKIVTAECRQEKEMNAYLYPNPFNKEFTITIDEGSNYPLTVEVADNLGRVVYVQKIHTNKTVITMDNSLPNGTYVAKITNRKQQVVKRIIKTR